MATDGNNSGWWWNRADARSRRRFAALMLVVQVVLVISFVSNPHGFLSGAFGWLWLVGSPFITVFLIQQFIRARRELRGTSA